MKKFLLKFLILILTFTCFSYAIFHNEEEEEENSIHHFHVNHIHAYSHGDSYGSCGNCGTGTLLVMDVFQNPTCQTAGHLFVMCSDCGYSTDVYPAQLPHNYNDVAVVKEATCTENGTVKVSCTQCGDSYNETIAALGHSYLSKVTKAATCTEDGVRTYTCSRCNDKYTKKIAALGHDIEYEEKEATCTEDGYKKGVCKRCGEETIEVYKALGHDLETPKVTKEATCTEKGVKEAVCKTCGEIIKEDIPALGHKYPQEWTLIKEPGFFAEGLEGKDCSVCGDHLEQAIPKKDPTPLYVGGGSGLAVVFAGLFLYFRKFRKITDKTIEEVKEKFEPSFEDKSVLISSKYDDLVSALKDKKFLEVTTCEGSEILEKYAEVEPDILITDILSVDSMDALLEKMEKKQEEEETAEEEKDKEEKNEEASEEEEEVKDLSEAAIGIVTIDELLESQKDRLDALVKEKKIVNYVTYGTEKNEMLVKLILPILKPDIKSDESLENIGSIADALGIPGISTLINVFVSGRDIKSTLEEGELGVSGTATIIADMASILGLEKVESVAGLVDDVDSIKAAMDKEAGAYERKGAIDGAKDIVEVVSDIVSKE